MDRDIHRVVLDRLAHRLERHLDLPQVVPCDREPPSQVRRVRAQLVRSGAQAREQLLRLRVAVLVEELLAALGVPHEVAHAEVGEGSHTSPFELQCTGRTDMAWGRRLSVGAVDDIPIVVRVRNARHSAAVPCPPLP